MQSGKVITGIAVGAIAALLLIPKTRKMIYDAACSLTDSLRGFADDAVDVVDKGSEELNKFADKANETKHAWS